MEYYVATTGSDSNTGTISSPWLTWHFAFNRLLPGDILYVRGGTYTYVYSMYYGVRVYSSLSGTSSLPITVTTYQDEVPILDCSAMVSSGGGHTGIDIGCNYWNFTGLSVCNVSEATSHPVPYPANGWFIMGDYLTFTRCNSYHNGGGFAAVGDYVYFTNCDAYENADIYDNGGYANGWSSNITAGHHMFWEGCRAWANSDDGYDLYGGGQTAVFNNCWAFENGYWNGQTGNGAGFKTGRVYDQTSGVVRTITNCLSFSNAGNSGGIGFDESQDNYYNSSVTHHIFNNTSYNNSYAFNFGYAGANTDIIRNNISYDDNIGSLGSNTVDHNSWQNGLIVTNGDFLSLDSSGTKGARGSDGSLPVLDFLHLAEGSHLIHAGLSVGLDIDGDGKSWNNPDPSIGAYEYGIGVVIEKFVTEIIVTGEGSATTIEIEGGTLQMLTHIHPHDATYSSVTWSLINGTGTGLISLGGLLTAITDGTVTIRATANDGSEVYGELEITFSNQITVILITEIIITGTGGATTIIVDNATLQMLAHINPHTATNQEIIWSVIFGTGSAIINSDGLLTAVNNGTVTVVATSNDGSGVFGTLVITISGQISTILVTLITVTGTGGVTTISISGGILQMLVHIDPHNATDKTYTWSITSGTSLASISETGLVTAARDGNIVVRAIANDGSGIYGTKTIILTNQVIELPEVYVPDGDVFCLSIVCEVIQPSSNTLAECYAHAIEAYFDPAYHINNTWLSEFRNYGYIGGLQDYDGNVYTTVTIGNQEWIIQNLIVTHYADGSDIVLITDNSAWTADTTGAMCYYNNDKTLHENPYGALYNWFAVANASVLPYFTRDGVQETGWKIPLYDDLLELVTYLGGNTVAGGKLKEIGLIHWSSPNFGADNSSGFTALASGERSNAGTFFGILNNFLCWGYSNSLTGEDYYLGLANTSNETNLATADKTYGFSVRCLRDVGVVPYTGYGCLYNWYAVNTGLLAPIGWHVPSFAEWLILAIYIDPDVLLGIDPLKETGTIHWISPNSEATNSTGFTLLPSGIRDTAGTYSLRTTFAKLWCSDIAIPTLTEDGAGFAGIGWDQTLGLESTGCSVRCLLDGVDSANPGTVTDIDGNVYPTVKIGTQVWMASNLKTYKYNDGTDITNVTGDAVWAALTTEAYCWYNNTPD
jgi:uncharacterized protein (TIGR02145 family)